MINFRAGMFKFENVYSFDDMCIRNAYFQQFRTQHNYLLYCGFCCRKWASRDIFFSHTVRRKHGIKQYFGLYKLIPSCIVRHMHLSHVIKWMRCDCVLIWLKWKIINALRDRRCPANMWRIKNRCVAYNFDARF